MNTYTVTLNYIATITQTVMADNEGEAYDKAREFAESADMNEFILKEELESSLS